MLRSWLKSLFGEHKCQTVPTRKKSVQLGVEVLENRELPAGSLLGVFGINKLVVVDYIKAQYTVVVGQGQTAAIQTVKAVLDHPTHPPVPPSALHDHIRPVSPAVEPTIVHVIHPPTTQPEPVKPPIKAVVDPVTTIPDTVTPTPHDMRAAQDNEKYGKPLFSVHGLKNGDWHNIGNTEYDTLEKARAFVRSLGNEYSQYQIVQEGGDVPTPTVVETINPNGTGNGDGNGNGSGGQLTATPVQQQSWHIYDSYNRSIAPSGSGYTNSSDAITNAQNLRARGCDVSYVYDSVSHQTLYLTQPAAKDFTGMQMFYWNPANKVWVVYQGQIVYRTMPLGCTTQEKANQWYREIVSMLLSNYRNYGVTSANVKNYIQAKTGTVSAAKFENRDGLAFAR